MKEPCCDGCAKQLAAPTLAPLADKFHRAAAAAGCTLRYESETTLEGVREASAELVCPDGNATVVLLQALAEFDADEPGVQRLAHSIAERFEPNAAKVARAIQLWVQDNIPYVPEPRETFYSPAATLLRGGDCDDHARLAYALLRCVDIPARIVALYKHGEPVHAVAQCELGGAWRWIETTIRARLAEEPLAAFRRLKASGRAELAA